MEKKKKTPEKKANAAATGDNINIEVKTPVVKKD